jgi:hypothetical protein
MHHAKDVYFFLKFRDFTVKNAWLSYLKVHFVSLVLSLNGRMPYLEFKMLHIHTVAWKFTCNSQPAAPENRHTEGKPPATRSQLV